MDAEILNRLGEICNFKCEMEGERCVSLSFHDPDWPFESSLRRNPKKSEAVMLALKLEGLRSLNIRKARLGRLPQAFLPNLQHLDVSCNDLQILPGFCYGSSLISLNAGSNTLEAIECVPQSLTTLKLHKNRIRRLPELPKGLLFLNLYLNAMERIPSLDTPCLEFLSFGGTECADMDDVPGSVVWLSLVANSIRSIPDSFTRLRRLKGVRLAKNRIVDMPEAIGGLKELRELSLYSNSIERLPESFFGLALSKLNLERNPLSNSCKERVKRAFVGCDFLRV